LEKGELFMKIMKDFMLLVVVVAIGIGIWAVYDGRRPEPRPVAAKVAIEGAHGFVLGAKLDPQLVRRVMPMPDEEGDVVYMGRMEDAPPFEDLTVCVDSNGVIYQVWFSTRTNKAEMKAAMKRDLVKKYGPPQREWDWMCGWNDGTNDLALTWVGDGFDLSYEIRAMAEERRLARKAEAQERKKAWAGKF
jgi:hypothetical protein